ncbi:MAG: Isoquinoline 1-oxidoreductase subunit, partial [Hyphomicrobiales bacterium]|nr:Isoquinoline 1-oxidoreductase subunit [Hyphomicrobiales bacterium]
ALLCVIVLFAAAPTTTRAQNPVELRAPSTFANTVDMQARSRALFTEASKVIMNPRCMNCHPAGDNPTQGNDMHPHSPPATRGADGGGVPGNTCGACHLDRNVDILAGEQASFRSIPGHPRWGLAPIEMAWQGKSLSEVCRQIKDPRRNGGRNLELLHEHLAKDDLVAWGWHPGFGRDPVPGTQQALGELIRAWIDSAAECP